MNIMIDKKHVSRFRRSATHRHCFGCCGCLIEQRGVGHGQTSKFAHHGLEIQQGFKATLTNFRLIGGVRRVPRGIFKHISTNDGRHDRAGVSHANKRGHLNVLFCNRTDRVECLSLAKDGGKVKG